MRFFHGKRTPEYEGIVIEDNEDETRAGKECKSGERESFKKGNKAGEEENTKKKTYKKQISKQKKKL